MCGFTGFIDRSLSQNNAELSEIVQSMGDEISHRGPDDAQFYVQQDAGYAVAFRRLAIIDLSPMGRQPMISSSGRYIITYNGEVYNAAEIRDELQQHGARLKGHSDTEVILEAIEIWGLKKTLPRLIGMFAIALWDRHNHRLTLVRDRLGIKPLYFGSFKNQFFFGSQTKCFLKHPRWKSTINHDSVSAYMRFGYLPSPHSIYKGVAQVRPGEWIEVEHGEVTRRGQYWSHENVAVDGYRNRVKLSDKEATDQLEKLIGDAIRLRMISDVPLGAFLSGGVDSSTVAALMQENSDRPIKTFSIGFQESQYNEAPFAKAVAEYLGTEHHEMYVTSNDALDVIPKIPDYFDEPFADSSQIPTYLLSVLTKQHVTVALSGDGGDELFAGYQRYFIGDSLVKASNRIPVCLRPTLAKIIDKTSPRIWDMIEPFIPERYGRSPLRTRALRASELFSRGGQEQIFRGIVGQWPDPEAVVINSVEPVDDIWKGTMHTRMPDFIERMQYIDAITYLPDDILLKVDRSSMATSLEARVPLLDHRVVEFAARLPKHMKVREGQSKWLLRQVLYRHVPHELIERPKMGFAPPIDEWLRGPLREWAEDLLDEKKLREEGIFNPASIRQLFEQHLSGEISWHYRLWVVLMFQAWKRRWIDV